MRPFWKDVLTSCGCSSSSNSNTGMWRNPRHASVDMWNPPPSWYYGGWFFVFVFGGVQHSWLPLLGRGPWCRLLLYENHACIMTDARALSTRTPCECTSRDLVSAPQDEILTRKQIMHSRTSIMFYQLAKNVTANSPGLDQRAFWFGPLLSLRDLPLYYHSDGRFFFVHAVVWKGEPNGWKIEQHLTVECLRPSVSRPWC